MATNDDDTRAWMAQFEEALRRAGVKVTQQRLEVFREVAGTAEHPDAETVYQGVRRRMPTISLDTVYRTLGRLVDLGLVGTLAPPRDRVRYDANLKRHHHFVCTRCGRAHDFYSDDFDRLPVPEVVKELGEVETTHIEMRGLCSRCAAMKPGESGGSDDSTTKKKEDDREE